MLHFVVNRVFYYLKKNWNMINLFKKLWNHTVVRFFIIPYCTYRIKKLDSYSTIAKYIEFAFNVGGGVIRPTQQKKEIEALLKLLIEFKPRTILEIGTCYGGSLFLFTRVASEDAQIISLDLPSGELGGYYEWRIPFYKSFAMPNQRIHLIKADSHDVKTLNKIKELLGNNLIDFLFIDADHTYAGVKKDFEMYSPLVREGGIIALHDINGYKPDIDYAVKSFWEEIKVNYDCFEIISRENDFGIGVIKK